ncbi:MAG: hypothetical protein AAB395_03835 [Patescibacteria group bacterium]
MSKFIFDSYSFDGSSAKFRYKFEDGQSFEEEVVFAAGRGYDQELLDKALFLAFIIVGVSYYKTFPSVGVVINSGNLDSWQADFFSKVYQEGLGQFAFENKLTRANLAYFKEDQGVSLPEVQRTHNLDGILALQSGGKDSLLTAALLEEKSKAFVPWYATSTDKYPGVLKKLSSPLVTAHRKIDHKALDQAADQGALNGHVPVTYIVQSLALVQAILLNLQTVLVSIAHEGEEPHGWIGDLPVNHQWSKSWHAEQMFAEYVKKYVSPNIIIGSPLRQYSELRLAEIFVQKAWSKFGHDFSSCNVANYRQGTDNTNLSWCGECPKCANSYLLFAPFVEAKDLKSLFTGQDLFVKESLQETFKGLLGIDDVMKPFECVGEVEELRLAYHMAQQRGGYGSLSFDVPSSSFDYKKEYDSQDDIS